MTSMIRLWFLFWLVFETKSAGMSQQTEHIPTSIFCGNKNQWPIYPVLVPLQLKSLSLTQQDHSLPKLVQVHLFILNVSVSLHRLVRYLNYLPVYLLKTTWAAGIAFI